MTDNEQMVEAQAEAQPGKNEEAGEEQKHALALENVLEEKSDLANGEEVH